jgi:DNA-binding transcriptional MerR regulator
MTRPAPVIPEKLYFKIGEVCELVGVQAHVLRYWETEFPMLSPQKNRSGQRSYRRKDVEVSLRIKELLYDDMFTIAGAKKKLQIELRENSRTKGGANGPPEDARALDAHGEPGLFDSEPSLPSPMDSSIDPPVSGDGREALRELATHLLELREMLRAARNDDTRR